jgi:alkylhydroperoxidase family enzyme
MRPNLSILALALSLPLVACGGADSDPVAAAEAALQGGDSRKAADLLQGHLAGLDRASAEYREVAILHCSALAESQPAASKDALLALATAQPDGVTPKDFKDVQSYLQTHGHFSEAIDVMDAGLKRWPNDATMLKVKDVLIAAVQSAGDEEATAKLKGLGYM